MSHQHTRRAVLRGLFAAGCTLCLPRFGRAADGKLSQVQAQYQDKPKGDQKCANCMHFVAPNSCKVVDGTISPDGWCMLWVKKEG